MSTDEGERPRRGRTRRWAGLLMALGFLPSPAAVLATQASPPPAVDHAVTLRPAAIHAQPSPAAATLAELPAGTALAVLARERLWLQVRTEGPGSPVQGWARLTEVRVRAAAVAPRAAGAPAAAGGFAGFSRSVSGLLGAFGGQPASYGASNSTIGIRGLTAADLAAAAPNAAAFAEIERYAVPPQQAVDFATAGGLVPVRLQYLAPPAPERPAAGAPWSRP